MTLPRSHLNSRKGPDQIETERLILRRPLIEDVDSIFSRYACDPGKLGSRFPNRVRKVRF